MIVLNEEILKTFIRLQLIAEKPVNDIISSTVIVCQGVFTEQQIRLIIRDILDEGLDKNTEVIEKLMSMIQQYVIEDYENLNIDEYGMDEADRVVLEILHSIGSL